MTTIRPLRVGIVSTALIGRQKVIPGLRTTPWVDVAAIASRDEATARRVAGELGIPVAHGSYEALFADPSIEAVYIPTPNDSHVDLSLAAGRAGKHVLCEKPAAMNAADADRLSAMPEGIVYAEAFMVRYHPQFRMVRDLVRSGRIGRPVGVQVWFSYANTDPGNIRNRPENGGGAMLDIGCYPIVTSRFVLDAEPRRIATVIDRDPAFGTDRMSSALVDFGEGRHLTFSVSTQCVPYQRFNVFGTEGRIEVMIPYNPVPSEETIVRIDDGRLHGDASAEVVRIPPCDQYGLQGEAFAKAVRGVEPLAWGVDDARRMMRLLDAAFAADGTWVDVA